jgi:hypothetical protein
MERRIANAQSLNLERLGENYLRNRLELAIVQLQLLHCWLPGSSPLKKVEAFVHSPVTLWPGGELLEQLNSVVMDLFLTRRRHLPHPYWKAYKWVNKLLPKIRLVRTVDQLVERARNRLREAGESYLMRLNREAHKGATQAQQLGKALREIKENVSKASKIKWEDYEQLLFRQDNKPVQLARESRLIRLTRIPCRLLRTRSIAATTQRITTWNLQLPLVTMKPTARFPYKFSVFATTPCRGLSLSR